MGKYKIRPARQEQILCPHCIEPIDAFDHFCPKCGLPVTTHASMDPMGQLYSTGRLFARAAKSEPKLIVLIGAWLVIGPQVIVLTFGALMLLWDLLVTETVIHLGPDMTLHQGDNSDGVISMLKLILIIFLLAIYSIILWKLTTRHIHFRKAAEQNQPGE